MEKLGLNDEQIKILARLGITDPPGVYELCVASPDALAGLLQWTPDEIRTLAERCEPELPPGYLESRQPLPPLGVVIPEKKRNDEKETNDPGPVA